MATKKSSDKKIELRDILLREFDGEEDSEETVVDDETQTKSIFELYKEKMSK